MMFVWVFLVSIFSIFDVNNEAEWLINESITLRFRRLIQRSWSKEFASLQQAWQNKEFQGSAGARGSTLRRQVLLNSHQLTRAFRMRRQWTE